MNLQRDKKIFSHKFSKILFCKLNFSAFTIRHSPFITLHFSTYITAKCAN
jgi:hypothetical protein